MEQTQKRLQSLKYPRDLTLGGTKPKKNFAPNLKATRNKDRGRDLFAKPEDKRKPFRKREPRNNNKKGFDRSERFVQSSGIFSDGMGGDALKKARYERAYSARDDTPSIMPVPKVKKDEWQVDNKNETKVYDDLMGCDSIIDDNEKLPFAPTPWNESDLKEGKVPISNKTEVKVKSESSDSIKVDLDRLKIETEIVPKEFQETDHYSDFNPAITLWNLPDSFSGKGLSDDPNVQTLFDYKLGEMLEGQIGKMQIHKSGKIEVSIGCVRYQVEPAQLKSCSEKLVVIDAKKPDTATSTVLGHVESRYILSPDWNYLLKDS